MARAVRRIPGSSSGDDDDDEFPEMVPHAMSKADAKRNQKALHDFEAEEKARRKAHNRERDQKLKERARVTRGGKTGEKKLRGVRFMDEGFGQEDKEGGSDDDGDDVEARMLRAMRDAADQVESSEGDEDDEDDQFRGFGQRMDLGDDMASSSDSSFAQEDDDNTEMSGENDSIDSRALTDNEEMDKDGETTVTPLQANTHKPNRKGDYLADDLFAAAFASQKSKPPPKKPTEPTKQRAVKERRRKFIARAKDLVIGGRTIRTLPRHSDPRSQATARSVPSARARSFKDRSLAMKGRQALSKAKKKGWERRPANIGVMKYQGAPHGFARSSR